MNQFSQFILLAPFIGVMQTITIIVLLSRVYTVHVEEPSFAKRIGYKKAVDPIINLLSNVSPE